MRTVSPNGRGLLCHSVKRAITESPVVTYHKPSVRRGLERFLCWIARTAYGAVNGGVLLLVFVIPLTLGYRIANGEELIPDNSPTAWPVSDSPIFIEGENDGAVRALETVLVRYRHPVSNSRTEARYLVKVSTSVMKPHTCGGKTRVQINLKVTDQNLRKTFLIRGKEVATPITCRADGYQSELDSFIYYAVLRQRDLYHAPFVPDEDGYL